jgi:hypothetical protein
VKIFVMVTMPMTQAAKDASRIQINPHHSDALKQTAMKRKENANKQVEMAIANKRVFLNTDFFSALVSFLEVPLATTGSKRTDSDNQVIELTLTLLRNLLAAGDTFGEGTSIIVALPLNNNLYSHRGTKHFSKADSQRYDSSYARAYSEHRIVCNEGTCSRICSFLCFHKCCRTSS